MAIETETSDDAVRAAVHAMWASVAGQWREYAEDGEARVTPVTEAMLARTAPRAGDRVLELACGPGGLGLAVAPLLGAEGEIVLSDVAAEMVAIAADRAEARGLANVRTAVLDLEAIDEPDHSFDVVLCREGLMFAVDPERAVREIGRVLRPAGRVGVSVWGSPADNPWLDLVFRAVSTETGFPVPPPGVPGPFSLGDETQLKQLFTDAGFADVAVEGIPVVLQAPSFEAWWARTSALAGPLAGILARLPGDVVDAITRRLQASVQPYVTDEGVALPGVALLVSGRA